MRDTDSANDGLASAPAARTENIDRRQFTCRNCGAGMEFIPGTRNLRCPHCGTEEVIPENAAAPATGNNDTPDGRPENGGNLRELDFLSYLERAEAEQARPQTVHLTHCNGCGADISLDGNLSAELCPYCGLPIVAQDYVKTEIPVQGLLPFMIDKEAAYKLFHDWLAGRWFAPNDLVRMSSRDGALNGIYMPYWTYDSNTVTAYTGERGEYYWVTETYTATGSDGRPETRSREVRKTRWYPASGEVGVAFDDILVPATSSLPPKIIEELEPWDLQELTGFSAEFLSGYRAEIYQLSLKDGFIAAQGKMEPGIINAINRDIGGDEQRIHRKTTEYNDVTFKHILLPIWISAYRYNQRTYRFAINGRSGEVQGERPYSWIKITLFTLLCLIIAAGAAYLLIQNS